MKNQPLRIGTPMPPFTNLPGVDGKEYTSDQFKEPILVIVFSCNHCPYVQAYEERMKTLQRDYAAKGVRLIAINANEVENYPDDRFEKMVERANGQGFNFLYLRDEYQSVAESFGATHTPQFFLFDRDRRLRYSGKMDDNWKDPGLVKEFYLRNAIDALLEGKEIKVPETYSIGCTIKWK